MFESGLLLVLSLLVLVPGGLLSEHDIAVGTLEGPLARVPQSVRLERQFRPEEVAALAAFHLGPQVHRLQVHLEQSERVEALLAQIALESARVLVLQHVLPQMPRRLWPVAALAAREFADRLGRRGGAVNALRVRQQRPLRLEPTAALIALQNVFLVLYVSTRLF
jgi:hypothetical protein